MAGEETSPQLGGVPEEEADEFRYHTGTIRPSKAPDAIEFVEVHKTFGRNHVLRGLKDRKSVV